MVTLLDLFPARVPIGYYVDASGKRLPVLAGEEFLRALQTVFVRLGGAVGPSITDLALSDDDDGGLEEFKAETLKALDSLQMQPAYEAVQQSEGLGPIPQEHVVLDQLLSEVAGLREQVAVLTNQINELQTGPIYGGYS